MEKKEALNIIDTLRHSIEGKPIKEQMAHLCRQFPGGVSFSTSLGAEDQVISDFVFRNDHPVDVFTLDTGRMFPETYKTLDKTREHYNKSIYIYFPESKDVEQLVSQKGAYSFYESVENRKECCFIRKVKPLKRALKGQKIWITGLRASQSPDRSKLDILEYDTGNEIIKYNPLLHWSWEDVWDYIRKEGIPYNPLHDKGFVSIGCQPCTRAIRQNEDFRAGRWWWEDNSKKECGLHDDNAPNNGEAKHLFKKL